MGDSVQQHELFDQRQREVVAQATARARDNVSEEKALRDYPRKGDSLRSAFEHFGVLQANVVQS